MQELLDYVGKTVDEMALVIGVHSATMYRELARGETVRKPLSGDKSITKVEICSRRH